jgi:hypothetical protein
MPGWNGHRKSKLGGCASRRGMNLGTSEVPLGVRTTVVVQVTPHKKSKGLLDISFGVIFVEVRGSYTSDS